MIKPSTFYSSVDRGVLRAIVRRPYLPREQALSLATDLGCDFAEVLRSLRKLTVLGLVRRTGDDVEGFKYSPVGKQEQRISRILRAAD